MIFDLVLDYAPSMSTITEAFIVLANISTHLLKMINEEK